MKRDDISFVLALDPSLSSTGYAVINMQDLSLAFVSRFMTSPKNSDKQRINDIVTKMFSIAASYNTDAVIMEDGFVGKNMKTAIQLSTLRGALMGVFSFNQYPVTMMLPSEIRKLFGIGGNSSKEKVAEAVAEMYKDDPKFQRIGPYSDKSNKNKTSDMYDAIAIGAAYAMYVRTIRGDSE